VKSDTQSAFGRSARAVDLIQRARFGLVADRSLDRFAAYDALQVQSLHQSFHRAAGCHYAFALELPPDLAHAIDLEVLLPDPLDMPTQHLVTLCTWGTPLGGGLATRMGVVGRWSDRQYPADRLDSINRTMLVDERLHDLNRRSSSA
jgi:hypothetical protein